MTQEDSIPTVGASDSVPTTTPPTEVSIVSQEENLRTKLNEINEIYGRNLISTYYRIGQALVEVFDDQSKGSAKYGKNAIEVIAEELNMSTSNLYRCQEVAVNLPWEQVENLMANPDVKWSHLREVVRIPDPQKRTALLQDLQEHPKTVVEFKKQVDAVRGEEPFGEGSPEESGGGSNRGGGSRTGTGHGASPISPIKALIKQSDKLSEALKTGLIALNDFDPESDKMFDRMADTLNEAMGNVCDLVSTCAGFVEAGETYMASHSNKQREEAQKARSAAYAQAVTALSKVSAGVDAGTLAPEQPDDGAVPPETKPPKAEKPKAPKAEKPEKAEKPKAPKAEKPKAAKAEKAPPAAPPTPPAAPPTPPAAPSDDAKAKALAEMREKARLARERAAQARSSGSSEQE